MNKKIIPLELGGCAFVFLTSEFMQRLYEWEHHELLGILFGSVNDSVWEACKTLLLPYAVWGMIELLAVRLPVHLFTAAKTAALYLLGAAYILLRLAGAAPRLAAVLSLAAACAVFLTLFYRAPWLRAMFAPSVALLFLFVSLYFSLTPFPLRLDIFRDSKTGMYGIIPDYLDFGAMALDTLLQK